VQQRTVCRFSLVALVSVFVTLCAAQACAKAHHIAVVADATFAQAVFALDDAEYQAWQQRTPAWTDAQHAQANPKIKHALEDVKAVTLALKAAPKGAPLPVALPDLITDLRAVEAILQPLAPSVVKDTLAMRTTKALDSAIVVLSAFAGGK
jgi:hypothetical protein